MSDSQPEEKKPEGESKPGEGEKKEDVGSPLTNENFKVFSDRECTDPICCGFFSAF